MKHGITENAAQQNAHELVDKITSGGFKVKHIQIEEENAKLRYINYTVVLERHANANGVKAGLVPIGNRVTNLKGLSFSLNFEDADDEGEPAYFHNHTHIATLHFFEDADERCYFEKCSEVQGDGLGNVDHRTWPMNTTVHAEISKEDFTALRAFYDVLVMGRDEREQEHDRSLFERLLG